MNSNNICKTGSKQKAPVSKMVTMAKLSVATKRLNAVIESFHASIEQKSFNLVEQHQKDVVTQLATVEELTYSKIANADESEHANLEQKLTTFCIESDELRSKALELSEKRKRGSKPNPSNVHGRFNIECRSLYKSRNPGNVSVIYYHCLSGSSSIS